MSSHNPYQEPRSHPFLDPRSEVNQDWDGSVNPYYDYAVDPNDFQSAAEYHMTREQHEANMRNFHARASEEPRSENMANTTSRSASASSAPEHEDTDKPIPWGAPPFEPAGLIGPIILAILVLFIVWRLLADAGLLG